MYEHAALILLYAEEPVHPGAGGGIGAIDLPVQREVHTNLPIMYGSGLKGSLKARMKSAFTESAQFEALFGKEEETTGVEDHNSALSFTDANLLAFPVKAASGLFAWLTSPRQLTLFNTVRQHAGLPALPLPANWPGDEQCLTPPGYGHEAILEHFCFTRLADHAVATALAPVVFPEAGWHREHFTRALLIVSDDTFEYFTTKSTEIRTRVRIDDATGVVADGALWIEEYLPVDTILFASVLAARPSRPECGVADAQAALTLFSTHCPALAQFGGNETVGKGFMRLIPVTEAH